MTFRRILYIALIHFCVMVCFPHYGVGGFTFGLVSCGVWALIAIIFGIVGAIFFLDKWEKFNSLVTALLLAGALFTILNYMPQENKISPLKKLAYGQIPTTEDINKGLKNFGINFAGMVDWVKDSKGHAKNLRDTDTRIKKAMGDLQ